MTSVAVVSCAVTRIKCLKELLKQSESLPHEADELLEGLQKLKESLVAATEVEAEFVALEKEIMRHSYEIVDAIADASFKLKEKSKLTHRKKSGNAELQELQGKLNVFRDELQKILASRGSEIEEEKNSGSKQIQETEKNASPEQKVPKGIFSVTGLIQGTKNVLEEVQGKMHGRHEVKKFTAYPGSEMQGEENSGSDQNREREKNASPEQKVPKEKFFVTRLIKRTKSGINKLKKKIPSSNTAPPGSDIDGETIAGPDRNPDGSEMEEEGSAGKDVDLLHRIRVDLLNPSSDSSEVYIVGKGGMGKSTLARKLFHDPEIRMKFDVLGWVSINQNFQIKEVLQVLLQQLGPRQQQQLDIMEMNEVELIGQIFDQLKNKTYLIVLDDIGAMDDWESIRLALPLSNSNRVIITTSSHEFLQETHHYKISGLTQPEILRLLEVEASFKPGSNRVGKAIFDISGGSPLFATILGKSLQSEAATTATEQKLLHELHSYEPLKGTPQVLGASYRRLAPELRPCLLYMGQFPQGHDIEVDKLYLLLVAENLLSPKKDSKITPQTLRDVLDELARLKFVQVQEDIVSMGGVYKSCTLHDQVREFCKSKGFDEEFLEIVEMGSSTRVGPHTRRLAIYLSKDKADNSIQFISHGTLKKILSILIYDTFESAEEKSGWPSDIYDLTEFSHLRILNFDGVNFKFQKVPKGVDRLVLLRYLSFRGCWLEELPSSMSHLTQLETLDLLVQAECNMLIPNNILTTMTRMVHLYLPRLYQSKGKSKLQLQAMEMLETLVNFDTEICDVGALSHLNKLKILSTICIGHSKHLDVVINFLNEGLQHSSVDIKSFDCYNRASVSALKELLQCQFVHKIQIEGQIGELPKEDESCGKRVAEIVLDGSQLEHDPISYLGKFQNLRSLVLSNDAYLGSQIVISAAAPLFRNLRSLKIHNLQYLEKLTIEEGAVPELSALQIDSCGRSLELSIPKKLQDRLNGENGGEYAYLLPPNVDITPYDQPQESGSSVRASGGSPMWKSSPI